MQSVFYVSHDGENLGPWTIGEIVQKIKSLEIVGTDFLYDEKTEVWIPIMEFGLVLEHLQAKKPNVPPTAKKPKTPAPTNAKVESAQREAGQENDQSPFLSLDDVEDVVSGSEWFVMKGNSHLGPFSFMSLIKAMQEKNVFEFDYVWKQGMESWVRIAELEEFKVDRIREMKENGTTEYQQLFCRRLHPRFTYEAEIIVHNDQRVWTGQTFQGSEGGSGVIIRNPLFVPGQQLVMHFGSTEALPAFKAVCEVVSKRFAKGLKGKHAPVQYGVRFLKIDDEVRNVIRKHSGLKAA